MITIIALLNSCAKTSLTGSLPPVTTTGAMTFGCVFNGGTPFAVNGPYVSGNSVGPFNSCSGGVSTYYYGDSLMVTATNCPLNTFTASFVFYAPGITTGTYDIGLGSRTSLVVFQPTVVRDSVDTTIIYYSDAMHGGKITFLRASDSIVSATFSAVLTDGHISWGVSNGRFDVKTN